jgi:undecaprenyl-diphosphatase
LRQRYPSLLPGGLLLFLTLLTIDALTDGPLLRVDRKIRRFVHATGNSAGWRWLKDGPATPARLLVDLGNPWVAIPVLLVIAALVAARRQTVRPLLTAGAGTALVLGTVIPAKLLIEQLNPGYDRWSPPSLLSGFPSGHAASACVGYFLAVLVIVPGPGSRARRIALSAAAVLSFAVGAALVWCGIHRLTEVVAGWALAALIVPLAIRLTAPRATRGRERPEQPPRPDGTTGQPSSASAATTP